MIPRLWASLRESYWFIPSVMCSAAVGLAVVLTQWDLQRGLDLAEVPWLVANRPAGARALLSMVAGSMITIAGVAFSVTLVALATAAGSYGPRVLNLFASDRAVHVSLGAFCSTFLYCTLVLRMVGDGSEEELFVPQLAVLGAIVLAVLSLGAFIYFVHHMAQSVHVAAIVDRSARALSRGLAREAGEPKRSPRPPADLAPSASTLLRSDRAGYVLPPDADRLVKLAREFDTMVVLLHPIGDFVGVGTPIARMSGVGLDPPAQARVLSALPLARRRSSIGDPGFFVDQLVQVAVRALSPGINDPFTATTCIDALEGVFSEQHSCGREWIVHDDADGAPRVAQPVLSFADYVSDAYGKLWPYAGKDPLARAHLTKSLERLLESRTDEHARLTVARQLAVAIEYGCEA